MTLPLLKAVLQVVDGSKAGLVLPVMFNPTEYNIERANSYKSTAVPGLGSPLIQFINGDAATLSMDLFVDDFTDGLSTPDSGILAGPPMPAPTGRRRQLMPRLPRRRRPPFSPPR